MKMYPYRSHKVHKLSDAHKEQRMVFCQWLVKQPEDFVQRVVWSDEKWFFKKTPTNQHNERTWSLVHPHDYEEQQEQGGEKVMAWVGIVDGRVLPVYWFKDDKGHSVSVNGTLYGDMVTNHVFPLIEEGAAEKMWWWQQDGATPHCTTNNINMLNEMFEGRVISRRADVSWPSCSPDLNPLDFWFWGYCTQKLRKLSLTSMQQICNAVDEICSNTSAEMVNKSIASVLKRAKMCLDVSGGHFQCRKSFV